jgi:acetyl-CoA carboxylase carboxyl transferase subunit beta
MPIKLPSFRPRKDAYPPDLWTKCPSCSEMLFNKQLDKADRVCPNCGHHFRLSAQARLDSLLDRDSFRELDAGLQSVDPLGFVDQKPYPDRIAAAQVATGLRDAAVRGTGAIDGRPVSICVMDFGFMGGSMGAVVGEKVTRAAELALAERLPLIVVSASGGARMQEGTLALMQLAKTCAALERLRSAGIPYISIMSDPTTGGVFASYAVLGDVNLAEPNALIGFAGARVTAGTTGAELPENFQRSEFLFEHGFVDRVVHRRDLRREIEILLVYLAPTPPSTNGAPVEARQAFSPIGFLSSLADRVVPDLGQNDHAEAPPPSARIAAPAPAASASTSPALAAVPSASRETAEPADPAGTADPAPTTDPAAPTDREAVGG